MRLANRKSPKQVTVSKIPKSYVQLDSYFDNANEPIGTRLEENALNKNKKMLGYVAQKPRPDRADRRTFTLMKSQDADRYPIS